MGDYEQRLKEEAAIAKVKEEHARQTMLDVRYFGRYAILGAFAGKGLLHAGLERAGFGVLGMAILFAVVASFAVIARIKRMGIGGRIGGTAIDLLAILFSIVLSLGFIVSGLGEAREHGREVVRESEQKGCTANLHRLGFAMSMYYAQHDQEYPAADKWCEELIKGGFADSRHFRCPAAQGGRGCHYAMNPRAMPYSRRRRVLLFETKGGWNRHGGPEMLSTENHGGRGCHIAFNNGDVEFVPAERFDRLRW
ncbi:MAG: hypothetical protein ACYSTJ_00850 [Planctomycetota bacterium]|jgi:hypothetical protein